MRTITAAFPIPTQAASGQAHSWIDALAAFGVPYLCYAADGRRIHVSDRARDLIDRNPGPDGFAPQADRVVAAELRSPKWRPQVEQFPLVREVPFSSHRFVLDVHIARPAVAGVAAVVIIRGAQSNARDTSAVQRLRRRHPDRSPNIEPLRLRHPDRDV